MSITISDRMATLNPSAIREILKVTADIPVIAFSAGNPSPDLFPAKELSELATETFSKEAASALQYGITEGYAPLRRQVSERIKTKYNIGTEDDDLIITSGGQQGIDTATKCLINEGDTVICENPSFIGALNTFRSYKANLVGIPMDDQGMKLDMLEEALKTEKNVKMIYTIPTFQNPMGVTLTMERRQRMYDLAEKYDVVILEDSPYFELRYSGEPVPTIKTLDKSGRVVFVGSFSKTIAPGIRVGFACGPKRLLNKMTVAKQGADVHTNLFFQILISKYMERYDYDGHIADCCALYREKLDRMLAGIDRYFDKRIKCTRPEGGLFIWCDLPKGLTGIELCAFATGKGVAAVPGTAFDVKEDKENNSFRLNFSVPSLEEIDKGIKLMGGIIDEFLTQKNI